MSIIEKFDKFNNSPKGKVIKSICLLVFSVLLVITAALAWFASNVNTTAGGMSVTVEQQGYATYSAFHINNLDSGEIVKTDSQNNTISVELLPYDTTFTSVNQYALVVLRVEIGSLPDEAIPTGQGTKSLNMVISNNLATATETKATLDGNFSSVGQVACFTSSTLSLSASNNDVYYGIKALYDDENNPPTTYKFATVNNNSTYTKSKTLSVPVTYSANNFKTNSVGASVLVLYFVLDYNDELTTLYKTQASQSASGGNEFDRKFPIANDLTNIDVRFN